MAPILKPRFVYEQTGKVQVGFYALVKVNGFIGVGAAYEEDFRKTPDADFLEALQELAIDRATAAAEQAHLLKQGFYRTRNAIGIKDTEISMEMLSKAVCMRVVPQPLSTSKTFSALHIGAWTPNSCTLQQDRESPGKNGVPLSESAKIRRGNNA